MKPLSEYVKRNDDINEGLLMNNLTKQMFRRMDPEYLYTGILNMYDYIIDNDDIKMFYKDFPMDERLFWKNIYTLYQKKVWSIFDADGDSEILNELLPKHGVLLDMTPAFRRVLRQLIHDSSNAGLDIKPSDPKSVMKVYDKQLKKHYVFTINRTTGIKGLFRVIDVNFLEEIFNKISKSSVVSEGRIFEQLKKIKTVSKDISKIGDVNKLSKIFNLNALRKIFKNSDINENIELENPVTTNPGVNGLTSEILRQLLETFSFFIKNAIRRYINNHSSSSYEALEMNIKNTVNNFLSSITKSQNLNAFDIDIENYKDHIDVTISFFENEMKFSYEIK